jgi:beta-aspartyl-peptidase (threonine type)
METFAIAVHGGAGSDSEFIKQHKAEIEQGLKDALKAGNDILAKGGKALDAVTAAVKSLEDNYLFNAGRGSALNRKGEVEMDASIMDGKTRTSGAVSMVNNVRNPVELARIVMEKTSHVFLSGHGALEVAKNENITLEFDSYFITDEQIKLYFDARDSDEAHEILRKRIHGTVGAVALDIHKNVAAATSSGGTENCLDGRIGDSCIIGAGTFADNNICAISGTGDGEFLINRVIANTIAMSMEYKQCTLQEACDYVILERNKDVDGDMGVIAVDPNGNIAMSFNSERMHRGSVVGGGEPGVMLSQ